MTPHRTIAAALALAAAWAAPSLAHAEVEQATIEDGAELAAAPESFSVTFSEPIALAALTLATEEGADVPVDFAPSKEPAATFAVPLPALEPGGYALTWRALADDGHVMTETIHFTVAGAADAGHGGHAEQ
jgi:methionine-rich copper-binding protein CopC